MTPQIPLTVFYSWQSDLPSDTNHRGIGACIKSAIITVEENYDNVKLIYDEAARDEPGSPEIPATIFNKISGADIFVCDITTINSTSTSGRKTPNPNVLIELGYAIALLGWERIVMVFNRQYGDFSLELPFDLEKRRVTAFTIKEKKDKNGKTDLSGKLVAAIETIIKKNPAKPADKKNKSPEEIRREKDIASLNSLLACIHIQTMDYFISELPDKVIERIFFFWHSFQEIYDTTAFHIYDTDLAKLVKQFRDKWGDTLSHGDMYQGTSSRISYTFYMPMDVFPNERAERTYKQIEKEAAELKFYFKDLIAYLRVNYIEVDLEELSSKALQAYVDHEKTMLDLLGK
jgi:hypothetical protein